MKNFLFITALSVSLTILSLGQGRGGRGAGEGAAPAQQAPTVFLGCVTGGNLQPVEQPFVLEPKDPWVLIDVLSRADAGFAPNPYRVTGINLTPWAGMRVRVEGALVPAPAGASGTMALAEIRATRVTSIWGTCPSPAALIPPKN